MCRLVISHSCVECWLVQSHSCITWLCLDVVATLHESDSGLGGTTLLTPFVLLQNNPIRLLLVGHSRGVVVMKRVVVLCRMTKL